jgi:hypothetical protein
MKNMRSLTAGLALVSLFAVNAGFADEIVVTETREDATMLADDVQRDRAEKANTAAVERAVEAVLADTRLDLDIRLIGPTSVKIAGER